MRSSYYNSTCVHAFLNSQMKTIHRKVKKAVFYTKPVSGVDHSITSDSVRYFTKTPFLCCIYSTPSLYTGNLLLFAVIGSDCQEIMFANVSGRLYTFCERFTSGRRTDKQIKGVVDAPWLKGKYKFRYPQLDLAPALPVLQIVCSVHIL